ncbi:MAG: polysaccharide deacetylase family protein [Bacilli bacterium]
MDKILILVYILILFCAIYFLIPTYYYKLKYKINRKKTGNKIYLTFDDGPSDKYTKDILKLLKDYNIKASFFCVASFAEKHEDIILEMKNDNHLVALHSYNHINAIFMGKKKTKQDLEKSINIMNNLNQNIKYYRPPWGDINLIALKELKNLNIKLVLWNVMAEDWKGNTSTKAIANKILKRTKGSDIICLHDGRGKNNAPQRTFEALKIVIPILLKENYVFETIDKYYEE